MSYQDRINRVLDFIGQNIDNDLSLEQLSKVACFSKFHFHRIFSANTGLSLHQYIRWLRLKRAARQLIINKDATIIEIAMNAGFDSHESFSRAFKKTCGQTPSSFRQRKSFNLWEKSPYTIHNKREKIMNVTIENIYTRRLAILEHQGDHHKIGKTVHKLISWSKSQPIDLTPKPGEAFGFAYTDPKQVKPEDFHFGFAITVPENFKLTGLVKEQTLPAGRYAVATHKGSLDNIGDTVYSMYRDWLPNSGEKLGNLPCIFRYHNFEYEVAETELITDVCLLLK